MTNEEAAKLDFQIAAIHMTVTSLAISRTILDNQVKILAGGDPVRQQQIANEMHQSIEHYKAVIGEELKAKVPETFFANYPKN